MSEQTFRVDQLADILRETLQTVFPSEIWIEGEIKSFSTWRTGHQSFDLIEPNPDTSQPLASLGILLFKGTQKSLGALLDPAQGISLCDGIRVRIRGRIDFYGPNGSLRIIMSDIDPMHTLGALEAQRRKLLEALKAEGLLEKNRQYELSPVPLRIGLITSPGTAAEADFLTTLETSGYGWYIQKISSAVQGSGADIQIAQAIRSFQSSQIDAIVVIRGGGSRTDLVTFDSEHIARAIVESSLPVLCGIGHEIDYSVADEVAHSSFKTPTACAESLVQRVAAFLQTIETYQIKLENTTNVVLQKESRKLQTVAQRLPHLTAVGLSQAQQQLHNVQQHIESVPQRLSSEQKNLFFLATSIQQQANLVCEKRFQQTNFVQQQLSHAIKQQLHNADQTLSLYQQRIESSDPQRLFKQGWSLTKTTSGKTVRSIQDVDAGETLQTYLGDGVITSTVSDVL